MNSPFLNNAPIANTIGFASDVKQWNDRTDSEKLEALREVVVAQQYQIHRLQNIVGTLERHSHGVDGKVSIRLCDVHNRYESDDCTPYELRLNDAKST
jgi:hypothetical protein